MMEHVAHKQFRREVTEEEAVEETALRLHYPDAEVRWVRVEQGSWGGRPTTEVSMGYTSEILDAGLRRAASAVTRMLLA